MKAHLQFLAFRFAIVFLAVVLVPRLMGQNSSRNSSSGLLGMPSVTAFGAIGDGSTDNTAAIQSAIASLTPGGGALYFPPAAKPYNFSGTVSGKPSQIIIPRNVTIWCSPDAVVLHYTGSSAALAWADSNGISNYNRGGMRDCTLTGNGSLGIGIYSGGDPAGVITPKSAYGDFLTFINDKIFGFAVGYQLGNNSWENDFFSTVFSSNTVGWFIPCNLDNGGELRNSGENVAMHGGSIQNGRNAVVNYNTLADVVLNSVSIEMGGSAIISGSQVAVPPCTSPPDGGTVELNSPHIEYFASKIAAPIFYVYGKAQFSAITVRDGWIQFDEKATSIESLVKMCDSSSCSSPQGAPHTNGFTLTGTQIHGGARLTWTGKCQWTSPGICIEGDLSTQDAVIGPYSYWSGGGFGSPNGSQFLPGLQDLIQYSGTAGLAPPICNATTPQRPVCVTDSNSCTLGAAYHPGGSVHCTVSCDRVSWKATGLGC